MPIGIPMRRGTVLVLLALALAGGSAARGAAPTMRVCGQGGLCGTASDLSIAPSINHGADGTQGVDANVHVKLDQTVQHAQLLQAAMLAGYPVTLHIDKWHKLLGVRFGYSLRNVVGCDSSDCPESEADYSLHFLLRIPKVMKPGVHAFWLTVGKPGSMLSTAHYAVAKQPGPPHVTASVAGRTLTVTLRAPAFAFATLRQPVAVSLRATTANATVPGLPGAERDALEKLTRPRSTVVIRVALPVAGHWYVNWRIEPVRPHDDRFAAEGGIRAFNVR